MHFCQEILDSSLCFPMGTLQNQTSTRACIVVFPFLPKGIASWISFCQVFLRASCGTTWIFGPRYHYRLTLIFLANDSSRIIFHRSLQPPCCFEVKVTRFYPIYQLKDLSGTKIQPEAGDVTEDLPSQFLQAQPEKQPSFSFQQLPRPSFFFHFHSIIHRPHAITPFSEWPVEYFLLILLQGFVIDIDIC